MKVAEILALAAKVAILLAVAILVGISVLVFWALLSHEVLTWRYGENLAPIDDTLPMILAVRASLLVSVASGVFVFVAGLRRFVVRRQPDRRRASGAHSDERERDPVR